MLHADGTFVIKHDVYQRRLKEKSLGSLRFIVNDARSAALANPDGPKAGYYEDEVHYAAMEIQRRLKK